MNGILEQFVDDYLERLMALVDHLQLDTPIEPTEVHQTLLGSLTAIRESHHHTDSWDDAIYALVALTDELLLEMPWSGRTWWNDHVLEASLFGTRLCSERFYQLANRAARQPNGDVAGGVFRVFYDCVLMGFRGVYSSPELASSLTGELGIPATIEEWLGDASRRLSDDGIGRCESARLHRSLHGAPPNADRRNLVWWAVAACTMLIANVTVYSLLLRPSF